MTDDHKFTAVLHLARMSEIESKQLVLAFDAVYLSPTREARKAEKHRYHTRTLA